MLGIVWLVLWALATTLALILAELTVAVFFSFGGSGLPDTPGAAETLVCGADRRIIQVHGTDSTGEFRPTDAVRALDPAQLPQSILEAERNLEFSALLAGASDDCLLTFSYDAEYFADGGVRQAGRNAWNESTSPWNTQPDELADRLQALMDAHRDATFDILAYSAGGIVPTYWAAREATTDAQRARVHSIVVVDGIVSGVDLPVFDWACVLPGLRQTEISTYGRVPCQFRAASPFTDAVRTTDRWRAVALATLRARGDLIVWHRFAGLPGRVVADPAIVSRPCEPAQWITDLLGCVLDSHGGVLADQTAIGTLAGVVARQ